MGGISSVVTTLFGCGLFGFVCFTPAPPAHSVSVFEAAATGTPGTTVVTTDINGKKHTRTIHAPYGVETRVITTDKNGKTTSEASTTPLSNTQAKHMLAQNEAQLKAMQQQEQAIQKQMQQMFAEQQKLFQQMQAGF